MRKSTSMVGRSTDSKIHAKLGGLSPTLVKYAQALRHDSTEAEGVLWQRLKGRRVNGFKFRRQHPLGANYIADFYCAEAMVCIELDGSIHDSRRVEWSDGIRQGQIQKAGVRVIRFKNERVKRDLDGVLLDIASACAKQPNPSDQPG